MRSRLITPFLLLCVWNLTSLDGRTEPAPLLTGDLHPGHALTLSFTGPETSESTDPNPFLDYRLVVTHARRV